MRPKTLLLVNVESVTDLSDQIDRNAMRQAAETVVALTPYAPDTLLDDADVLLPIGTWAETSGTFVNVAGVWQSFTGVANPVGLARPAWKVLRVLANLLKVPDSDYESSAAVLAEMREHCESLLMNNMPEFASPASPLVERSAEISELEVSLYQSDNIVRRAAALQNTQQAARERPATFVSSSTAEVLSSG
jgi:NADH-quinone oxidoreductase subunit G